MPVQHFVNPDQLRGSSCIMHTKHKKNPCDIGLQEADYVPGDFVRFPFV